LSPCYRFIYKAQFSSDLYSKYPAWHNIHRLFISLETPLIEKRYFSVMKFSPGQSVIVLDTTYKPAGAGIVQIYNPVAHQCTVLFQYPGSTTPESIPIPEYRLVAPSQIANHSL
jgi:hypothetical protein